MSSEHHPLLPSDHPNATPPSHDTPTAFASARNRTKRLLTSKAGHYSVLLLVSLDVIGIFADLILQLMTCEGRVPGKSGAEAQTALGWVSLVFSCLFMGELVASVWAFWGRYFYSWFHCLDATVITASFVVDVVLRGVVEEVGSLIIVLRLFRVFKIIEELSAGAEEQMAPLHVRIQDLEMANHQMEREIEELKRDQEQVAL